MSAQGKRESRGQLLKVVEQAFEIFEYVIRQEQVGVTELATRLDLPTTTAHVYLNTLRHQGYLINENGKYRPSLRVLESAGRVRNSVGLYQAAKSEIHVLAHKTGEVVTLGISEEDERVFLDYAEGENAIWANTPIGARVPMHMTAIGKSMLAHFPSERLDAVVEQSDLRGATEHTISSEERLRDELAEIRERGYAIENQEHRLGVMAIGMPIMSRDAVLGAIAICGPTSRLSDENTRETLLKQLAESVNIVELRYEHY